MENSPSNIDASQCCLIIVHRYRWLILGFVFAIGLAFRVWGNDWGLPGRPELHPDEHDYVMTNALKLSWDHPDPGFLNYPAFLMYLVALIGGGLRHLGIVTVDWQAYLVGRWIVALFGAGTALACYLLVREIRGGTVAALLAALWAALLPLSIWESHTATTDCVMTFWLIMALWGAVRLMRAGRWSDYALAGALVGLATGSKYPAAMAAVAIPAAALLARHSPRQLVMGFIIAGGAGLVAMFCVAPFSLLRIGDLIHAMQYENSHAEGHHFGFSLPLPGWQYHRLRYQVVAAWPFSMGFVLYACAVIGTAWNCGHMKRCRIPLFVFALVFTVVVVRIHYVPLRYYLPLLALCCCFAGLWQEAWLSASQRWRRGVALMALLGCLVYTGIFSWQTAARWACETRVEAGRWLDSALPRGGTMLMLGWHRYGGMPANRGAVTIYYKHQEAPISWLEPTDSYDLIQITSLHYARHYRERNVAMTAPYNRLRDPKGEFTLVKRFESHFLNKSLYEKLDPMFGGYFVSPTLEFYRPKHPQGPVPSESKALRAHGEKV